MSLAKKAFNLSKTKFGELIVGLAFEKFSGALPVKKVRNTNMVIAFWHPRPCWEKHIVIVPKKAIRSVIAVGPDNAEYIGAVYEVAADIMQELKWDPYIVTVNGGSLQHVKQIHFHLWSGEEL